MYALIISASCFIFFRILSFDPLAGSLHKTKWSAIISRSQIIYSIVLNIFVISYFASPSSINQLSSCMLRFVWPIPIGSIYNYFFYSFFQMSVGTPYKAYRLVGPNKGGYSFLTGNIWRPIILPDGIPPFSIATCSPRKAIIFALAIACYDVII